ncbi:LysR substrate-binding domain-containing protein [Castellaniella sp.]|uniref:LysR family transcriptional regulator n=1 Tax=Castellaniella sp. TaxID=1955812 RepID=UPI00355F6E2D
MPDSISSALPITLRQFQQLITLSEAGSFRRAAEQLHLAQPALSVSIQKLEQAIGVRLVERGARGARLTAAGLAVVDEARSALFHARQARQVANLVATGAWGTLQIGFVSSAIHDLLPRIVDAFRLQYPDVRLILQEDSTAGVLQQLKGRELDAGLVRSPFTQDPVLQSWVIQTDDLMLLVPAGHRLAHWRRIRLAECRDEAFIMNGSTRAPGVHSVARGLCHAAGFEPRISLEAIQVQTMLGLVANNMGIALVPAVTRHHHADRRVRFVALDDPGARGCIALSLVQRLDNDSALARRLHECVPVA